MDLQWSTVIHTMISMVLLYMYYGTNMSDALCVCVCVCLPVCVMIELDCMHMCILLAYLPSLLCFSLGMIINYNPTICYYSLKTCFNHYSLARFVFKSQLNHQTEYVDVEFASPTYAFQFDIIYPSADIVVDHLHRCFLISSKL